MPVVAPTPANDPYRILGGWPKVFGDPAATPNSLAPSVYTWTQLYRSWGISAETQKYVPQPPYVFSLEVSAAYGVRLQANAGRFVDFLNGFGFTIPRQPVIRPVIGGWPPSTRIRMDIAAIAPARGVSESIASVKGKLKDLLAIVLLANAAAIAALVGIGGGAAATARLVKNVLGIAGDVTDPETGLAGGNSWVGLALLAGIAYFVLNA
jgi:hypothetical protein